MNIQRFVARDMRAALREIRASLGADAVMLSSRNVPEGVEIIAAIDYDGSLLGVVEETPAGGAATAPAPPRERPAPTTNRPGTSAYAQVAAAVQARAPVAAARDRAPVSRFAEKPAPVAGVRAEAPVAPAGQPEPQRRVTPGVPAQAQPGAAKNPQTGPQTPRPSRRRAVPPKAHAPAAPEMPRVAAELNDLRQLLENQLASLAWNDMNRRQPADARCLRQLASLGIDPKIAKALVNELPRRRMANDLWRLPLQRIAERLPLAKQDLADLPGVYAVVGPTGVGKTTTIAKIAARFVLRHGVRKLGLVSTDCYRIGAREQLMTFARILGTPMQVASNAAEMTEVLDSMRHKRLILVDTAGMSQRDVRLAEQFATLRVRGHKLRSVLALSAASDLGHLRDALHAFRAARPIALIATKLDEATSLGPMLSLLIESGLTLAYLSDGQRVPEDLHLAGRKRAWLLQQAMRLAHSHAIETDEDALARQFARLELAANA